jgi:hypothetical protein
VMVTKLVKRGALELDPKVEAAREAREKAELYAWSMYFKCGIDFFSDLDDIGAEPSEAKEAWRKLGAKYLETFKPSETCRVPYALKRFGPPGRLRG